MYGLIIDGRQIRRILSGDSDSFGSFHRTTLSGRCALVDQDSKKVVGYADLTGMDPVPATDHCLDDVPRPNDASEKRGFRYTVANVRTMVSPKRVFFGSSERFVVHIDEFFLDSVNRQSSLTDFL